MSCFSSEVLAGDTQEFSVWVTANLEVKGAGWLVGNGIPNDPENLSLGGGLPGNRL